VAVNGARVAASTIVRGRMGFSFGGDRVCGSQDESRTPLLTDVDALIDRGGGVPPAGLGARVPRDHGVRHLTLDANFGATADANALVDVYESAVARRLGGGTAAVNIVPDTARIKAGLPLVAEADTQAAVAEAALRGLRHHGGAGPKDNCGRGSEQSLAVGHVSPSSLAHDALGDEATLPQPGRVGPRQPVPQSRQNFVTGRHGPAARPGRT